MQGKWRFIIIPFTIGMGIASLWIPLSWQEITLPHAQTATLILSSGQRSEDKPREDKPQPRQEPDIKAPSITALESLLEAPREMPIEPEKIEEKPVIQETSVKEESVPEQKEEQTTGDVVPLPIDIIPDYSEIDADTIAPRFDTKALAKRIVYPPAAKRQRIEGEVLLLLYISKNGKVQKVDILFETGYGFGEAAKKAFLSFQGTPAMKSNQPLAVKLRYPIRFILH